MAFKPPSPTAAGLWRRTPPAIFPSIMGLYGLGLAWRRGAVVFDLPAGIAETILGAVTLLFLFSLLAYAVKLLRRPAVILDDLRILPGRAGMAAMVLCLYLLSITAAPYSAPLARAILWLGFAIHGGFALLFIYQLATGPAEQRRITPVWHLGFVGPIIGALAATVFEQYLLALAIFVATAVVAALIWAVSAEQIVKATVPAPLRPLLAIHLAPLALFGLVADALELEAVALGCAGIAALVVLWCAVRVRWLTEAGFSPLWGAFTFPIAATANLWLAVGGIWRVPGAVALVAATLIILPISWKMLQLWARGQLAVRTNAATA